MDHPGESDGIMRAKAPWRLAGDAYMVDLKMPEEVLDRECFLPEFLKGRRLGTTSTMIYVDYRDSPVGPYKELLFIPPKFRLDNRSCRTISKLFVSTPESVVNGRDNWGIPKTLAEFESRKLEGFFGEILDEETVRVIAELRRRGYITAVSSNNFQHLVDQFVSRQPDVQFHMVLGFKENFAKGKDHFQAILNQYGGLPPGSDQPRRFSHEQCRYANRSPSGPVGNYQCTHGQRG